MNSFVKWVIAGCLVLLTVINLGELTGQSKSCKRVDTSANLSFNRTLAIIVPYSQHDYPKNVLRFIDQLCNVPGCLRGGSELLTGGGGAAEPLVRFFFYTSTRASDAERRAILTKAKPCLQACGIEPQVMEAQLTPAEDKYLKNDRSSPLWVAGPNNQFYRLFHKSELARTDFMFLMEPDCEPVQWNWLVKLLRLISNPNDPFWIKGSPYLGNCVPVGVSKCEPLGLDISAHINGNALYAIGNTDFREFVHSVSTGVYKHWPFDVAMYKALFLDGEANYRRLLSLYQHSTFVRNYGSVPVPEFVRLDPRTLFIHHSDPRVGNPSEKGLAKLKARKASALFVAADAVADPHSRKLMVTFVSAKYLLQFDNFMYHASLADVSNRLLAVAFDRPALTHLRKHPLVVSSHLHQLDDGSGRGTDGGSDTFNSTSFMSHVNARWSVSSELLDLGFNVFNIDLDVILLRNPFDYLTDDYDFQVQSDSRLGFQDAGFREFLNGGVWYGLGNSRTTDMARQVKHGVETLRIPDQDVLNRVISENTMQISYRALEPVLFPNGWLYSRRQLPQRVGVSPVLIHFNWVSDGHTKEFRMRELGYWMPDKRSRPQPGEKFLSYDPGPLEGNGLNNQRNALRCALAIAELLDRILILPPIYSHHKKPLRTDLQYFFSLLKFEQQFPNFRESSFLDQNFAQDNWSPQFYIASPDWPSRKFPTSGPEIVQFNTSLYSLGATETEIRKWFAPYNQLDHIRLVSAFRTFHRFDDDGRNQEFRNRMIAGFEPAHPALGLFEWVRANLSQVHPSGWNCFHFRRGDFVSYHPGTENVTTTSIAKRLTRFLDPRRPLYIATNEPSSLAEFRRVFSKATTLVSHFPPHELPHLIVDDSMFPGLIDQHVCAHATGGFVGNIYSTFTVGVCALRQHYRYQTECVDIYNRQLPSQFEVY